ncbi:restriction endonuclease subunit S [Dietzia maris]
MNWPTHPAYKNSGVQWLGEVPAHWGLSPMLTVGHERTLTNAGLSETNLLSLSYGRIVPKDIDTTDGLLPASFDTYQIVEPCDIVFRFTDLQNDKRSLRSALVPERGIITSAYMAFSPTQIDPKYFSYLMRSYDLTKVFYSRGGGLRQSLKYEDVKRLPILVPPTDEQRVISRFLDRETAKIDALIDKQEQLIATLREDRAATITQAVTKGLDQDAELLQSDSKWLGPVPIHWSIMRLRDIVLTIESGTSVNCSDIQADPDEAGVLKTSCVSSGTFDPTQHKTANPEEAERVTCPVTAETIIVNRANAPDLVGSAGYVKDEAPGIYLSDLLWSVTVVGARPDFVHAWMQSAVYRTQVAAWRTGTSASMQKLSKSSLRSFEIALPPIEEQGRIVELINSRCADIDALTDKSTEMIEVLREYRSALITNAVTGKIDVREAV